MVSRAAVCPTLISSVKSDQLIITAVFKFLKPVRSPQSADMQARYVLAALKAYT